MILREKLSIGLPRMHLEPGERRDFLPGFVAYLQRLGCDVVLESKYGSGMGYTEEDYLDVAVQVNFANLEEVYSQNYILVLRYPGDVLINQWC